MSFKVVIVTVETFMVPPLHINCLERERERESDNKVEKIYMKTSV
jgi:hypothetical protein